MILNQLKKSEWGYLLDFVSPSFFDVVPLKSLIQELASFTKQLATSKSKSIPPKFKTLTFDAFQNWSLTYSPEISSSAQSILMTSEKNKSKAGHLIVTLYFYQILQGSEIWIDLRSNRFWISHENKYSTLHWSPAKIKANWLDDFIQSLKMIYTGFYKENDRMFRNGLKKLNLEHAEDLFRKHFASGNQSSVVFDMNKFVGSFHEIFLSCKNNDTKLHRNFLSFGLYLAGLYDVLSNLGTAIDVRKCFFEALNYER